MTSRTLSQRVAATTVLPLSGSHLGHHVFFLLAVSAVLMSSIDSTIVAVALPQLTSALDAPLVWVAWTITAYQLTQIIVLPLAGKLSDSVGRRQIFLLCISLFTLGSLLCGLAPSIGFLIAARALQAIGGGGLMPSAVGLITDHYREHRAQARGLFSSVFPIGAIVGPNLGGFILEHWGWRDMFFINVPVGLVVLAGAAVLLRGESSQAVRHMDLPGVALYGGGLLVLLFSLTLAGQDPGLWRSPLLWLALLASVGLGLLFLRHIRRAADPVMDFRLVARQPFLATNLYNLFFGAVVFGVSAFIPSYAVSRYGLSPLLSGAVLTPRAIVMIVTSVMASLWLIRLGYRLPMLIGAGLVTLMLLLLASGWTELTLGPISLNGFWVLATVVAIGGAGLGLANPASNNASLDLAPDRAAALTGVRNMFRLTGGVTSVTLIVLVLTAFPDRAQGLSTIYGWLSLAMLVIVPLTFSIPDTARHSRDLG
jgi:EmrB/QacA subfamily drug resistance transporter